MTGGEASDYNAVPDLLAIPVGEPRLSIADKGYDGDFLREKPLIHGIRPVIPPKANRKNLPACDFQAYKDRNRIKRMFNRLKQFLRVASRRDPIRQDPKTLLSIPRPSRRKDLVAMLRQRGLIRSEADASPAKRRDYSPDSIPYPNICLIVPTGKNIRSGFDGSTWKP
nr:hypothetical protein [Pannonibacter phragmitetus]